MHAWQHFNPVEAIFNVCTEEELTRCIFEYGLSADELIVLVTTKG